MVLFGLEGASTTVARRRIVGGIEIAVAFTLRGERQQIIRIISVRRAKRRERRQYHAHLRARGLAPD
jgi:uncharacterized DUF497 family protein